MARTNDSGRGQPSDDALDDVLAELAVEEVEWTPEVAGESVAGFLVEIEYKELSSGRILPVLTLRTKAGTKVRVAAGRKVLASALAAKRVQVGDALGIQYEGTKRTESGQDYHNYRLAVRAIGPRKAAEAFQADRRPERAPDLGLVSDPDQPWDGDAKGDERAPF
jgi:hypothetical protein